MFRDSFEAPVYEDAQNLSDQLLLPHIVQGRDVHLAADFLPSYVVQLVRDLAESKDFELGFLNLNLFVRGNLGLKSVGISQFRTMMLRHHTDATISVFIQDALQLASEGGLRLTLVYSDSSRRLIKGSFGLISPPGDEDFVAFVDSKAGDHNSPVRLFKSWSDDEEYFISHEILDKISILGTGRKATSRLVSTEEVVTWLNYIDEWYEENPPSVTEFDNSSTEAPEQASGQSDDDDDDDDEDTEFLDFLLSYQELQDDKGYDWVSPNEEEEFEISAFSSFGVVVSSRDAIDGHVPPLPYPLSDFVGPAPATCTCGRRFMRALGCDAVAWDL